MSMVAIVDSDILAEASAHPGLPSHGYCPFPLSLAAKVGLHNFPPVSQGL